MDTNSTREPFALLFQFLTLLVLTWIGLGVWRVAEGGNGAAAGRAGDDTLQLQRALEAFEQVMTRVAPAQIAQRPHPTVAAPAATDPPSVPAEVRQNLREIRTALARTAAFTMRAAHGAVAEGVSPTTRIGSVRRTWDRLGNKTRGVARLAKQELLLSDRRSVLLSFGKPGGLSVSKASEAWYYYDGDDLMLQLFFHDGLVTRVVRHGSE